MDVADLVVALLVLSVLAIAGSALALLVRLLLVPAPQAEAER